MKRFLMLTCIAVNMFMGCAVSQEMNTSVAGNLWPSEASKTYINDINTRAMRDFMSRYKGVTNANWHKSNDLYVAVFYRDSIQNRIIYNSRGDLEYIMKYYREPNLRRDVRAVIKSVYFDYSIFIIQEIEKPNAATVYIVNIEDANCWKKIKVSDGEMEVMESFNKK